MADSGSPLTSNSGSSIGDPSEANEIAQDLFCQDCGYNLRGLTGSRCPECGHSLDTVRLAESQIPWVYRKEQGWFRAYWQTVALVMFRQRRFCEEMARPVDYGNAQRFRFVTILHVYVPFLLATAVYCALQSSPVRTRSLDPEAQVWEDLYGMTIADPGSMAIVHVGVLLYLIALTGLPSYFFHPRGLRIEMQNRAIALSYYASASLSISALPIAAFILASQLDFGSGFRAAFGMVGVTVVLAQILACYLDLTRICRRIMPQFPRRVLLVGTCVPLLGISFLVLTLFGIYTIDFYVRCFVMPN